MNDRIPPTPHAQPSLPVPGQPRIRLMLDLSTCHLPEDLGSSDGGEDLASADGVTAYRFPYGFIMWVPDSPVDSAEGDETPPPDVVLAIQLYARQLGCDFVLFDCDADPIADLPTFDW